MKFISSSRSEWEWDNPDNLVEAMQWTGANFLALQKNFPGLDLWMSPDHLTLNRRNETIHIRNGSWIVVGNDVLQGSAVISDATFKNWYKAVFVHTDGMDCPCGPQQHPVGIVHVAHLDTIEVTLPSAPVKDAPSQDVYEKGFVLREQAVRSITSFFADLDRCEHGRHRQDNCFGCPDGQSSGNKLLETGRVIGHDYRGRQIVVPPQDQRRHVAAWYKEKNA